MTVSHPANEESPRIESKRSLKNDSTNVSRTGNQWLTSMQTQFPEDCLSFLEDVVRVPVQICSLRLRMDLSFPLCTRHEGFAAVVSSEGR
jgi:hypothetical protein